MNMRWRILIRIWAIASALGALGAQARPVRVLVWDEQQPQQKPAYTNWLGGAIATHLQVSTNFEVRTARLDDPSQGVVPESLDTTDVLIWWGHVRNADVPPAVGEDIAKRVESGKLALIALHSAHWSAPFIACMDAISRQRAIAGLPPSERPGAVVHATNLFPELRRAPGYQDRLTPAFVYRKPWQGPVQIDLTLPNCCFPQFRNDGQPSRVRVLTPAHPISRGVPPEFTLEQTEMYNEPFHVPQPDQVILEEHWANGEWFRSGALWRLGRGAIFYFRPGHETYPVYTNANVLKIVENAAQFLGNMVNRPQFPANSAAAGQRGIPPRVLTNPAGRPALVAPAAPGIPSTPKAN